MEFNKSRVYTALNADELKPGDKVIVADDLDTLKRCVKDNSPINTLRMIGDEDYLFRFDVEDNCVSFALAYLVERAENCTNCKKNHTNYGGCENLVPLAKIKDIDKKTLVCWDYVPTDEPRAEKCLNCKHYNKRNDFRDCTLVDNPNASCPHWEAEKKYRPFKDTDELIKVWNKKFYLDFKPSHDPLTMPLIWVRDKKNNKEFLLTEFDVRILEYLFTNCEFLDGSVCGVEE